MAGKSFDLVFLGDARNGQAGYEGALRAAVRLLGDGGRVVASASKAGPSLLAGAGLEVLSRGAFLVGRKPSGVKKLSLAVGMISMNEEGAVGGVIDEIKRHAPEAEVLLVDSSKDRTAEIAQERGARVIKQFPPRGYGPAMFRLLYETTADVIITMDCDGTYPADRILSLHAMIERGEDLVNATRTRRRPKTMPFANFLANRVFATTAHVLHGVPTTDVHSGMRAYRTSMLRGIDVNANAAALPVDLMLVPARMGYRIAEVEIPYFERVGTTTLHRFDSTMWTFRRMVRDLSVGSRATRRQWTSL
jgi:glycosyltransferase involved in cell wall biosynthesis